MRHPVLFGIAVGGVALEAIGWIGSIDTVSDIYAGESPTLRFLSQLIVAPYGGFLLAVGCLVAMYLLDQRGAPVAKAKQAARRLAELRDHAINDLQNRVVGTRDDQDALDADRHKWMVDIANVAEDGGASQVDLTRIRTLGVYTSKGLRPLVPGGRSAGEGTMFPNDPKLAARNEKHRNEVAERVERLEAVIRNLEAMQ